MVSQTRDTLSLPAWAQGLVWLAINLTDIIIYTMQLIGNSYYAVARQTFNSKTIYNYVIFR